MTKTLDTKHTAASKPDLNSAQNTKHRFAAINCNVRYECNLLAIVYNRVQRGKTDREGQYQEQKFLTTNDHALFS